MSLGTLSMVLQPQRYLALLGLFVGTNTPALRPACSLPPTQALSALQGLALCTEAVPACGDVVAAGGGLAPLLALARAPCRSKEAAEALRAALACLANLCRSRCASLCCGFILGGPHVHECTR
jgi:hypothetical protein